ncbi:MAG TPA: pilus assembly protein TadG-related protein [Acidimicrobiia bacterium]|jgi:Flp pilus assembly protein TadG|nr:pilus assembly protein TadG-related protein [Acidimicrobiia bacterium]
MGIQGGQAEDGRRARRARGDEGGFVLVWTALFLLVLLGFAALAIDFGHAYFVGQHEQNAADAASLAGAVYLPGDVTTAYDTATSIANTNGFKDGDRDGVAVTPQQQEHVSQLKVTITETIPTLFAKVLGFKAMTVTRSAVADYRPPVAMGSPNPQYGNDPDSSGDPGSATYPNLWGNVTSYATDKQNGNAYTSGVCNKSPIDGCAGSTNQDYTADGYYYAIHFNQAATVNVQVFDPGFVAVGNNCISGSDSNADLADAATTLTSQPAGWPVSTGYLAAPPFDVTRYAPVTGATDAPTTANPGNRYCTGDSAFGSASQLPATTYSLLGPAVAQGDPSTAVAAAGCSSWTFPGVEGTSSNSVVQMLAGGATVPVSPAPQYLATYFRQWFPICTITGQANTDYFLQVNGDANGSGNNNFSIRATQAGGALSSAVSIYGNAKMAIYANAGKDTLTQFYLARIPSNDAGQTLSLHLFDIGDAGTDVTGSLTIVPPTDSGLTSFSNCTAQSQTPSFTPSIAGDCKLTNVSSDTYQGRWVSVNIPIPANYLCDDASPTGCWFRIDYEFNGAVSDVTSWTAVLAGDPVRIVQ